MSNPMIRIHDLATNEIIDREMTTAEFAEYEAEVAAQATAQAEAQTRATAKAALLERLGITAEETALLLA